MRQLTEKVKSRKAESLAERLLYCAGMLHLGEFMSDAERIRVHKRMMKWKEKCEATKPKRGATPC